MWHKLTLPRLIKAAMSASGSPSKTQSPPQEGENKRPTDTNARALLPSVDIESTLQDFEPPSSPLLKNERETFDYFQEITQRAAAGHTAAGLDFLSQRSAPQTPSNSPERPETTTKKETATTTPTKKTHKPLAPIHRQRSRSRSNSNSSTKTTRKYKDDLLEDESEDMSDDPKIQRYAEMNDGLQWGMGALANVKAFKAFPEARRVRSQTVVKRAEDDVAGG